MKPNDAPEFRPTQEPDDGEEATPEIPIGVEPKPAPRPSWRDRRGLRNGLRHLHCATRTGAKIVPGDDGPIVVETAA